MIQKRAELPARIQSAMFLTPMIRLAVIAACLMPLIRGFASDTNPHAPVFADVACVPSVSRWGWETGVAADRVLVEVLGNVGSRFANNAWGLVFAAGYANIDHGLVINHGLEPVNTYQRFQTAETSWLRLRITLVFLGLLILSFYLFQRRSNPVLQTEGRVCTVGEIHGLAFAPPICPVAAEPAWQDLLDSLTESIVVINEDDDIEAFNSAAEILFGYSGHEVIGRQVDMLMPGHKNSGLEGVLIQHINNNQRVVLKGPEYVGRRKDGSLFPMEMTVTDTRFGDQNLSTGVIRDMSATI